MLDKQFWFILQWYTSLITQCFMIFVQGWKSILVQMKRKDKLTKMKIWCLDFILDIVILPKKLKIYILTTTMDSLSLNVIDQKIWMQLSNALKFLVGKKSKFSCTLLKVWSWGWKWNNILLLSTMLVCEHENESMWASSICISRYPTTNEGAYNINTYNIGIHNIVIL